LLRASKWLVPVEKARFPDDRYALARFQESYKKRGDAMRNRKRNDRDADQHSQRKRPARDRSLDFARTWPNAAPPAASRPWSRSRRWCGSMSEQSSPVRAQCEPSASPVSLLRRISTLRVNYIVTAKILRDVSRQVDLAQRRVE
jgi:hypothetical protein